MKKKVISAILCGAMVLGTVCPVLAADDKSEDTKTEAAAGDSAKGKKIALVGKACSAPSAALTIRSSRARFSASFNYSAIPNSSFIFTRRQRAGLTQVLGRMKTSQCVSPFRPVG